jgi:precorrin-6Y C5,15-methyltransferase (decarboxylating)
MLTIIGNGMGGYNFNNIKLDISKYDKILCDKNFQNNNNNVIKDNYTNLKTYIFANYKTKNLLYIVSGSPLFFSAGILIAKKLPKKYIKIIDNTSCKSYMQEKLQINDNEIDSISLHGRKNIDLTKFLTNIYTFVLCDKYSIKRLKKSLKYIKKDDFEITKGYKLGYKDEIIQNIKLKKIPKKFNLNSPYVIVIKRLFTPQMTISKDEDFKTQRGMITKKYKRDLSLQNLDLLPNDILWDIGSGSGSCAIEAYKRYKVKTILFENQEIRCKNIKQNLINHFVCDSLLLRGDAQEFFNVLQEIPNKILIGGGGDEMMGQIPYLYKVLKEDGIILINIVTLKNLSKAVTILNKTRIIYEIVSLYLTTYKGNLNMPNPQRQLFWIKITKPKDTK